jgi:hypothetical protein
MMAFLGRHMSSGAVDKKLSTCCIDILKKKIYWFTEIGVPLSSKIVKVRRDQFCKMKLNLLLFL